MHAPEMILQYLKKKRVVNSVIQIPYIRTIFISGIPAASALVILVYTVKEWLLKTGGGCGAVGLFSTPSQTELNIK